MSKASRARSSGMPLVALNCRRSAHGRPVATWRTSRPTAWRATISRCIGSVSARSPSRSAMTFALFFLYLVLSYIHPGEIVPALVPYRFAYWVGLAGLAVAVAQQLQRRGNLFANLQLWVLLLFAGVMSVSLMVAERWLG